MARLNRKLLTERRQGVLDDFIRRYIASVGYPPSVREIAEHLGSRHPTAAVNHLDALEQMGAIRRHPYVARGLVVLDQGGTP